MNQTHEKAADHFPRQLQPYHARITLALLCLVLGFASQADQFIKVTNPGWINSTQFSVSGAWGDYDNDRFIDLFVANTTTSWLGRTNFVYHNNGNGTFTLQLADQVGFIASDKEPSAIGYWGDVNNDEWLDLLVLNLIGSASSPPVTNRLYLNQGKGAFLSVATGDLSRPSYCWGGGGLADYDNDGCLDAFAAAAWGDSGHRTNLLYYGKGDGTFRLATNCVIATDRSDNSNDAAWGDFDNDGFPDLVLANNTVRDFLYHNDGRGQFTRMTNSIVEKYQSWHHAWGDYDNDGFLDLATTHSGGTRLLRNSGGRDFVSVTNWSTDGGIPLWADYDNDGYLDLLVIRGGETACELMITAEPNRAWQIQASEDLERWQTLATVTNTTAKFGYTDTASATMISRFYRVVAE
jgi:hypothetical protein